MCKRALLSLRSPPHAVTEQGCAPAKEPRSQTPFKNPSEIHQFTNSQIYKFTKVFLLIVFDVCGRSKSAGL
jgi:hypothetical protein